MSERLPLKVNPFRLAQQGRRMEGLVALKSAERLAGVLCEAPADARVSLAFSVDEAGVTLVEGRIQAELAMLCQRCLEPARFPVDVAIRLALVESDTRAAQLQEHYEVQLVTDETLWLLDLIEDELLLALPLAPAHASLEACGGHARKALAEAHEQAPAEDEAEAVKTNPFAVLKTVKPS